MPLPLIVSIPHCGAAVPPKIRDGIALDDRQIKESVDFGTHEIFAGLPAKAVVSARWSRLVTDLNRNPAKRDPKGVIALADYNGRTVFMAGQEPSPRAVEQRIDQYHAPYHAQLRQAMADNASSALIDCHSLNHIGPADAPDAGHKRKDVTLSNYGDHEGRPRNGSPITCPANLLTAMAAAFEKQDFSVSINDPYKGGYIINHYAPGLLAAGRIAVQIEMNQGLYMDDGQVQPDSRKVEGTAARVLRALTGFSNQMGKQGGGP